MIKAKKTISMLLVCALMLPLVFVQTEVVEAASVSYSWPTTCHTVTGNWGKESGHYYKYHYGIDIAAKGGAKVKAAAPGTVYFAKLYDAYGYTVAIKHSDGKVSLYAHMKSNLKVKKGEKIKRGQLLGYVSGTGSGGKLVYAKHLHFGLYKSTKLMKKEDGRAASKISYNPINYLGKSIKYTAKFATGTSDTVKNMPKTQTVKAGDRLYLKNLSKPIREGYVFAGWKNSSNGKVYKSSLIINGSRTFTAQWEKIEEGLVSEETSYGAWRTSKPSVIEKSISDDGKTVITQTIQSKSANKSYAYYCDCKKLCWTNKNGTCKYCGGKTKNLLTIYSSTKLSKTGYKKDSSDGAYYLPKTIGKSSPGKFGTIYCMYYSGKSVSSMTTKSKTDHIYVWPSSKSSVTVYRVKQIKKIYDHSVK